MKRESVEIARSSNGKVSIHVDKENAPAILEYLKANGKRVKRFNLIKQVIFNESSHDCYKWEIEGKIRDVYAMRFDLHKENGRIYCKQVNKTNKVVIVIASELHHSKKVESNGSKEIAIIKRVNSYEYDV